MSADESTNHTCDNASCAWRRRFDSIVIDLQNAEVDLLAKRREVASLKSEMKKLRGEVKYAEQIDAVFNYWRVRCKHPKARLGEKRKKVIAARLREGFTVEDIQIACDGAARFAFRNDHGEAFDDIELICRDETKLEAFKAKGMRPTDAELPANVQPLHIREGQRPVAMTPLQAVRELEIFLGAYGFERVPSTDGKAHYPCPACKAPGAPLTIHWEHVSCSACGADAARVTSSLRRSA